MLLEVFIRNLNDDWKQVARQMLQSGSKSGWFHFSPTYGDRKKKAIFCTINGEFAGVLTYRFSRRKRRNREMFIDIVSVEPRFRKLGVGKAMVDLAYNVAVRSGSRRVHVSVSSANAPSLALMKASGFNMAPVDLTREVKENMPEDDFWS